jgi:hypothetical protein
MRLFTQDFLYSEAIKKGYNKTFIKVMIMELIPYHINSFCESQDLIDWAEMHCYKPVTVADCTYAAEFYNLENSDQYKTICDQLYDFVNYLLKIA